MGATVGSVIPTAGAVIPAAVGVDIGCGMIAAELDVTDDQLPDSLEPLLHRIEPRSRRAWGGHDQVAERRPVAGYARRNRAVGRPGAASREQFGTLGSGTTSSSCASTSVAARVVLHSGSRGIGNQLAMMHISTARNLAKAIELRLEDLDLAYFTEGTPNARHTSPTCSGRRSMRGPTAKR